MKRIAQIIWLVLIVGIVVSPLAGADDAVTLKVEGVTERGSLDGVRLAGVFAKREDPSAKVASLSSRTRAEVITLGNRMQVDIGKMEAELSELSRTPAAKASSMRKGLPAVQGAAPMANIETISGSLLRQAENLGKVYQREGLEEGMEEHSGPMVREARRLNQLANEYPEAVKSPEGQRVLQEMKDVLGRLKSQASAHKSWVQGLAAAPVGEELKRKPVPAMKVAPGEGGVMHDKWSPDLEGGDGESLPAVQQPENQIFPKVEMPKGESGYEGVDGESLGQ
jgi:hypothetical protein